MLFTDKTDKHDFFFVPLRCSSSLLLGNLIKKGISVYFQMKVWDFIDKPSLALFAYYKYSEFQENNHRKSMRIDTEMKQILKSKLSIA